MVNRAPLSYLVHVLPYGYPHVYNQISANNGILVNISSTAFSRSFKIKKKNLKPQNRYASQVFIPKACWLSGICFLASCIFYLMTVLDLEALFSTLKFIILQLILKKHFQSSIRNVCPLHL